MSFRLERAAIVLAAVLIAGTNSAISQSSDERFETMTRQFGWQQADSPKAAPRRTGQSKKANTGKSGTVRGPVKRQAKQTASDPMSVKSAPPPKTVVPLPIARPPVARLQPPVAGPQPAQSDQARQSPAKQNVEATSEKLKQCFACHGADGRSETPEIPSLAGQPALFVLSQLKMMADGKRQIPAMQPFLSGLTEDNLRSFADTISKLPKSTPPQAVIDPTRYERGQKLATASRCANCHNNDFTGAGTNPGLARQRDDYLVKALRDYKSGARVDAGGIMVASVKDLKDADFVDLAYYLANLR
jgi:cytochrome c553